MVEPAIPYLDTASRGMKDGQNGKFMVGRGARFCRDCDLRGFEARPIAGKSVVLCRWASCEMPTQHRFTRVQNRGNRCSVLTAVALC